VRGDSKNGRIQMRCKKASEKTQVRKGKGVRGTILGGTKPSGGPAGLGNLLERKTPMVGGSQA